MGCNQKVTDIGELTSPKARVFFDNHGLTLV